MDITLYKYKKRMNSTQRPESDETAERTKMVMPAVKINSGTNVTVAYVVFSAYKNGVYTPYSDYNYCYIPLFKRYYWIRDWSYSDNGTATATCEVDPLASFKEFIAGGTGYIHRSSNVELENKTAIDTFYPALASYRFVHTQYYNNKLSNKPSIGSFVIGVLSKTAPVFGAVNYYIVNTANMATLLNNMLYNTSNPPTSADAWKTENFTSEMLKSIVSPIQYIVSCKWIPVYDSISGIDTEQIYLGTWNTGAYGHKITSVAGEYEEQYYSTAWVATVPKLSDRDVDRARTRDYPPYASYYMYNSLTGTVTIDPVLCACRSQLGFKIDINYVSGEGKFTCKTTATDSATLDVEDIYSDTVLPIVFVRDFRAGIDINITQVATDFVNLAKSGLAAVATAPGMLLHPISNGAEVLSHTIDAAVYAMSPGVQSLNGDGNAFWQDIATFAFVGRFQRLAEPWPAEYGYSVEQYVADNQTLSDYWFYYVVCSDFHPDPQSLNDAPLKNEYDSIIDYLRRGVFLE